MLNRFHKPDTRYERRMARIAYWDRPVSGWGGRLKAWSHMILNDHGIFRLIYLNKHKVSDRLYRAAQPAPHQLAAMKAQGIRTIINLRGGREHGSWQLEKEACDRLGLTLVDFVVRSRGAPERETILKAKEFFDALDYPALMHCKSGADRAGFMAVLYLILEEGHSVAQAMKHLSLSYGHFRFAKTGILDVFFETYAREGEARGLSLLQWVETIYDPEKLERDFHSGTWSSLLIDKIMRRE